MCTSMAVRYNLGVPDEINTKLLDEAGIEYRTGYPLSRLTSLRTGGDALIITWPRTALQLETVLSYASQEGLQVSAVGNMTNILASDSGWDGMLICMNRLRGIVIKGDLFISCAGEILDTVINKAIEHNLCGLEELGGIPGTIGGATVCNAGANGKQISDYFFYADYITPDGKIRRMPSYSDAFSYRTSPFRAGEIIISAAFRLSVNRNTAESREKKEAYRAKRIEAHQFDAPSAGCFFKNPPLLSAGKLIEEAGLKGFSRNGALVSPWHANFIVNQGSAASRDIFQLAELVRSTVCRKFNIELEYEVKLLGKFETE